MNYKLLFFKFTSYFHVLARTITGWIEIYILEREDTGSTPRVVSEIFLKISQSGVKPLGKPALNTQAA